MPTKGGVKQIIVTLSLNICGMERHSTRTHLQSLELSFADQIQSCCEPACGAPSADGFITLQPR